MAHNLDKLVGGKATKSKPFKEGSKGTKATCSIGDTVKVDYTGTLENGQEFDSSKKAGHLFEFTVGSGMVIKGFDKALVGMKLGEEKDITVSPEEGYGLPNPQLIREIQKPQVANANDAKAGMVLMLTLPNGNRIPAKILEVGETTLKIDLNHLLAGKTLRFKIKLVEIL